MNVGTPLEKKEIYIPDNHSWIFTLIHVCTCTSFIPFFSSEKNLHLFNNLFHTKNKCVESPNENSVILLGRERQLRWYNFILCLPIGNKP